MSETITSADVLTDGDLVHATKGELLIQGRVVGDVGGLRRINGHPASLAGMLASGMTVTRLEKAKPVIPTAPGLYTDSDGDFCVLTTSKALRLTENDGEKVLRNPVRLSDGLPSLYAPYTLVEKF